MKKIILFLGLILISCKSRKVIVQVNYPVKSFKEDLNESIVCDFYDGDTLNKKVFLVK